MSAGKVSMLTVQGDDVFLHLFFVAAGNVTHLSQGPDNVWVKASVPLNPAGAPGFVAIKGTDASYIGLSLLLVALDLGGGLWWATADGEGTWDEQGWQQLPLGEPGPPYTYFDIDCNVNAGLIVVAQNGASSLALASFDGQMWTPGWGLPPGEYTPYNSPAQAGRLPFPPPTTDVSVTDDSADRDSNEPLVSFLTIGEHKIPFTLHLDDATGEWQWSKAPVKLVKVSNRPDVPDAAEPPYPELYFTTLSCGAAPLSLLIFLTGGDGNIYFLVSADNAGSWSYGGLLPNPDQIKFQRVLFFNGFPVENNLGILQVVALGGEGQDAPLFPYVFTLPNSVMAEEVDPTKWRWSNPVQLPAAVPSPNFTDFDFAGRPDSQNVQLGLLGSDSHIYINFQEADGIWGWYGGQDGTGLP